VLYAITTQQNSRLINHHEYFLFFELPGGGHVLGGLLVCSGHCPLASCVGAIAEFGTTAMEPLGGEFAIQPFASPNTLKFAKCSPASHSNISSCVAAVQLALTCW
jgi:hypothetical protein